MTLYQENLSGVSSGFQERMERQGFGPARDLVRRNLIDAMV